MGLQYYKVTKGPGKGFVGLKDIYATSDGMCKKGEIRLTMGADAVVVKSSHVKPAGKEGEKLTIDHQVRGLVTQIKDLMNRKKRLDQPDLTDAEIKKLLECIELEE